jgi:enoyl-CoA hydratase/carnithine racemase
MTPLKNHELLPELPFRHIRYENRPVRGRDGAAVAGLHQVWISLDNPAQLNSYTTEAVKEVILAFRRASADRRAVAVVFTAGGARAFCTGGNTEEYATYYAGRPLEYLQYMRLFNDMVTAILLCDKPVVCRVNGMRIGGGQEIGMACDFSIAGDHAALRSGGPGARLGPDGGSTDFLHLHVGYARAAESLVLCEPWSAHMAHRHRAHQRGRAGPSRRGRPLHPEPARRHRPLARRGRPDRLRRVEDRAGAPGGEGAGGALHRGPRARWTRRSTAWSRGSSTPSPTARGRRSRACARRSSSTGTPTARRTGRGSR